MSRVFLTVLDAVGAGELPDAADYGDVGTNTLGHVIAACDPKLPNMASLGLGMISSTGYRWDGPVAGAFGRAAERSKGKDTTSGHWEIAGVRVEKAFPTFPHGFPASFIEAFEQAIGHKVIGNCPESGTVILDELGVGRVIARPFIGTGSGHFIRTGNRRDFSLPPCGRTLLDAVKEAGMASIGVGKIEDIFAHQGLTKSDHAAGNPACIESLIGFMKTDFNGLCFTNLVDTDSVFGHRNDPKGFASALESFDVWLKVMLDLLNPGDLMIITADHGCDPTYLQTTDHSREYIPILAWTPGMQKAVALGDRKTYADIGATCAEWLGLPERFGAESFADALR